MEEVGTQLASPLFIHQNIAGRFCDGGLIGKKRSVCYGSMSHHQQQLHTPDHLSGHGWNPKDWEWDSNQFIARPRHPEPNMLHLGTVQTASASPKNKLGGVDQIPRAPLPSKSSNSVKDDVVDGNSLRLQLGGVGVDMGKTRSSNIQNSNSTSAEEPATSSRPNKKTRSGSPGSGGNYPMCQVDNCREDLSKSKDYHRRHKVCELHSKATNALVGKQMQRFCQQCSRFHPLSEFDEGKRSCRRRLAGHNRRRRKTQPEDDTSTVVHPVDGNKAVNGNLDIVNLLTVLAGGQANIQQNAPACPSLPDKNQLIQILSKINSLPMPTDTVANPIVPPCSTKHFVEQGAVNQRKSNATSGSTTDLLTALSATLGASTPDAVAYFSQRNGPGVYMDQTKSYSGKRDSGSDACKKPGFDMPSSGGERSSSSYQSPTDSDCQDQEFQLNLPLQLFNSSPGDASPPNVTSSRNYLSSDSSNPPEERSPLSTPPFTKKLFPLETTSEIGNPARMSFSGDINVNLEASQTGTSASRVTLELFNVGNQATDSSMQMSPYPAGYASSGSDHSPPSFNSDPQMDRTGRISFKLFDKDPSHLPVAVRTQIYNWLSNSPSEMESYIRPGCVFLSVYVSMSSAAWAQLEEDFLLRVGALIQGSDFEFWRSGRFSVNIGRQLAIHNDGRIRLCKPWSTLSSPELFVVTPLAVVSGEDTPLMLRGRNLTSPGTKIHCTFMGGYSSKEVIGSSCQGLMYDEIKLNSFKVHTTSPSVLGRCFIEVENGVRGNSFPVIIADAQVCQELRLLESEFIEEEKAYDTIPDDQFQNIVGPRSHEEVLHFLNELGWLFQRQMSPDLHFQNHKPHRFQLLLTFSVERDYCALVKRLLDIFVEWNSGMDGLSTESLDALAKIHLLHRAVKRKSKKMVDLLIHYSLSGKGGTAKNYIFPPNLGGPGGITALHLAACTFGSNDIVDVLTDDPMQIGLKCWNSLLDDCGQSPYAYAMLRNNLSLNNIVAEKLCGRKNEEVTVSIGSDNMEIEFPTELRQRASLQVDNRTQKSCSKCATMTYGTLSMSSSRSFLHRPFVHSMLAIAAVCVCVCLLFKSMHVNPGRPFKWEDLGFGTI